MISRMGLCNESVVTGIQVLCLTVCTLIMTKQSALAG